ncbi:hypothetical protein Spith_2139 [Spirochaeta thermophila DSM 6578]|uniref:Uncharacterized protein n=1 Tax=Winmispira thermophila (strain ATCC 700085 / DSM 6578 / Z-1203) TaxID=869211 RepID=G0GFJ5_WINT7|nr:hypothetical protein [Spirochaeta thermophila]AEJ62394.1 hypothetical protein Spith_2139 [Spirochaeta thermophila DSM 6578]
MNQDQVKQQLLRLEPGVIDFTVIFSGKQSKKANGVYYPDRREIIIHNRNFSNDNDLMYTAIHEFAHHIYYTTSPLPVTNRVHTQEFWTLFHSLLERAEEMGIYQNIFDHNEEFQQLTETIKRDYIGANGKLMKDLGRLLVRAESLCEKYGARFEDYVERVLGLGRTVAHTLIKAYSYDVSPEIGYENMKTVVSFAKPEERKRAEDALLKGVPSHVVKTELRKEKAPPDPLERLQQEKMRIERTIENLSRRLEEINALLEQAMGEGG